MQIGPFRDQDLIPIPPFWLPFPYEAPLLILGELIFAFSEAQKLLAHAPRKVLWRVIAY